MTIPTSNIAASLIQTEFGGANPIGLSEYYGKGNAPASGTIKYSDFSGTTSQPEFPTGAALITKISQSGGRDVWFMLMTDGTITKQANTAICSTNWRFPTLAGIGTNYWCRVLDLEGASGSWNAYSTVYRLNANQRWGWSVSFGSHLNYQYRLQISNNSAMTGIVSDVTFPMIMDN